MNPGIWHLLATAGLSPEKTGILAERFRSSTSSLDPLSVIRTLPELSDKAKAKLELVDFQKVARYHNLGLTVAHPEDFPEPLHQIHTPPPFLFTWGQQEIWHQPCVAIVGTRSATHYGKACAQKFGEHLSDAGFVIVSGGAAGIDAAAHRGALGVTGKTIAVCACGLDRAYPPSHEGLFTEIREKGLLVSAYALGAGTIPHHFLERNVLIAALSMAVLVIEGPKDSGSLVTAQWAAEFGRPVYVVPGPITGGTFKGSHNLIRNGATLVDHPGQILDDLMPSLGGYSESLSSATPLNEYQSSLIELLGATPLPLELLCDSTGLEASDLMAELTELELQGVIERTSGGYIRKI
ncbi:MAG: DNA-processing protein DprA [Fimbriimonadaceae bacterium]|jgi:DNA processing protein|nr:DNA-processing protein DprA [Fimbriimonadaceae bacterium]